jgi:hypothetical protein
MELDKKIAARELASMLALGLSKEVAIIVATVKLELAGFDYARALKTAREMAELV